MTKCDFCGKSFSTKYILQNHQKRAKFCLAIQEEKTGVKQENDLYECEFCHENFAKNTKTRHLQACKQRLQILLHNSEEKVKELQTVIASQEKLIAELQAAQIIYKDAQECLKQIAKQPRVQNQTNNQLLLMMPLELSKERIKQTVEEKFTEQHFCAGQKGVAKFAVENLLKDENGKLTYICTDPARSTFKHRSSHGEVERDTKAVKLSNLLVDDVVKKSTAIVNVKKDTATPEQFNTLLNNYTSIKQLSTDNCAFRGELAVLTVAK